MNGPIDHINQPFDSWPLSPARPTVGILASEPQGTRLNRLEFTLAGIAVFLAPMNFLRHPNFYITLSDVFALASLTLMLLNRAVPLRPLGSGTAFWILGLTLLIGGLTVSSLMNGDIGRGLIVSGQYFYAYFILPLVIAGRPSRQIVSLIKLFVLSIVIVCLHGIYLIHVDGETNTRFVSGSGRLLSFVERENECASLIALTLPLLLWLSGTGHIRQILAWPAFLLMVYGVLLTGSNTGLIASVYVLAVYFICTISWRKSVWVIGGVAAAILLVGTWGSEFLPAAFQKRVLRALESGNIEEAGSFVHRMDLVTESIATANETTWLGLGADQNRVASDWGHPVHNVYLLVWTEGGLIALMGMILILLGGLAPVREALGQRGAGLSAACTLSIVSAFAFLINAVPHVYGRFWVVPILLGISLSLGHLTKPSVPSAALKKRVGDQSLRRR